MGTAEEPEGRAEDVADALSLLRAARADLDGLEAALLLASRQPSTRTGKPLLTFRQIAAAIGRSPSKLPKAVTAARGRPRRQRRNPLIFGRGKRTSAGVELPVHDPAAGAQAGGALPAGRQAGTDAQAEGGAPRIPAPPRRTH
jgi:hypothetical protein